jgi:DNA-binding transcriptional MerR regulator
MKEISVGTFTTRELAKAAQVSEQAVRDYEAGGLLTLVPRRANGYRDYSDSHLAALLVIRALKDAGYDRTEMKVIMQAVHGGDFAPALAIFDVHHAGQHARRNALAEAERAASSVCDAVDAGSGTRTIGEAANCLGVTKATLRFWEAQGLLTPRRDAGNRYRRFAAADLARIATIQRLRAQGSSWAEIRAALDAPDPACSDTDIAGSTLLTRATAMVWAYAAACRAGEDDADAAFWSAIGTMRAWS